MRILVEKKVKINGENGGFSGFSLPTCGERGLPESIFEFWVFRFRPEEGGGVFYVILELIGDFDLLFKGRHQVLNPVIFSTTLYAI